MEHEELWEEIYSLRKAVRDLSKRLRRLEATGKQKEVRTMAYKSMTKTITTTVDVSWIELEVGHYVTIGAGDYTVEVVRKEDGTLQVCVDDETRKSGIHRFEDIYGPDPWRQDDDT